MKQKLIMILLVSIMLLSMTILVIASPNAFSLPWWTVDSGGGGSQGGQYAVTGTIGQHDTGTVSGGPYGLDGGFWHGEGANEPSPSETPDTPEPETPEPLPGENSLYIPQVSR